jgi:hypothetical protein
MTPANFPGLFQLPDEFGCEKLSDFLAFSTAARAAREHFHVQQERLYKRDRPISSLRCKVSRLSVTTTKLTTLLHDAVGPLSRVKKEPPKSIRWPN